MSSDVPVGHLPHLRLHPADEPFTYENWCRACAAATPSSAAGRCCASRVDGQPIGDTLTLPAGGGTVEVEADARVDLPDPHAGESCRAGASLATTEEANGARSLTLRAQVKIDGNTWLARALRRPGLLEPGAALRLDAGAAIMAHTSPIYVAVGGRVVDCSTGDGAVYADADRRIADLIRETVAELPAGVDHPPPRGGGPPGVSSSAHSWRRRS